MLADVLMVAGCWKDGFLLVLRTSAIRLLCQFRQTGQRRVRCRSSDEDDKRRDEVHKGRIEVLVVSLAPPEVPCVDENEMKEHETRGGHNDFFMCSFLLSWRK